MQLTDLTDQELDNLRGNALRLAQSAPGRQQIAAKDMLPGIAGEISRRAAVLEAEQKAAQVASLARRGARKKKRVAAKV